MYGPTDTAKVPAKKNKIAGCEVCAVSMLVPGVKSVPCQWWFASKLGSSPPERLGLDNITTRSQSVTRNLPLYHSFLYFVLSESFQTKRAWQSKMIAFWITPPSLRKIFLQRAEKNMTNYTGQNCHEENDAPGRLAVYCSQPSSGWSELSSLVKARPHPPGSSVAVRQTSHVALAIKH